VNAIQPRILHLLSQRPDSTGSGIYVQAMIREAGRAGCENFLVAGSGAGSFEDPACIDRNDCLYADFDKGDIHYHIPGMSDVMPYESTRFCDLSKVDLKAYKSAFSEIIRLAIDRFQPNIIHSHHLWIVSSLARQLYPNIPMVTSCHGSDLRQFQNCPHLQEYVLSGCRNIDLVLALSAAQKEDITRLYGIPHEKIRITGAGYNGQLFYPDLKQAPEPVQLVYAGKLSHAKGVPWLLRALKSIESPAWQLHLIGDGSGKEKKYCLQLAGDLEEKVHIHGAVSQHRLAEIIRQSHLLVLPSFYEGLPLVILEGLASGCRIVVTDLPGTQEILGEIDCDFISFVKTPRLYHTDQPYPEDEVQFEEDLKTALHLQMLSTLKNRLIDLLPVRNLLGGYTWAGVFKKVEQVYRSCIS